MRYSCRQIVEPLELIAPKSTQEGWDNSGFLVGDPNSIAEAAVVGLDCTLDLVEEAVEKGANLIITHHPLIFKGIKSIIPNNYVGRIITELIKHNIVLYSAHTNLDKAENGVSRLMANRLGLTDCEVLSEEGFGLVGELCKPMDCVKFVHNVKELFGVSSLRCSRPVTGLITKVAVCGGAGRDFISNAISAEAQAYVTGDIGYHNFYTEEGFMLLDIGHYESEVEVAEFIKNIVSENFTNFAVYVTERNNNPIYYY